MTGDVGVATAVANNINVIAGISTDNSGSSVEFTGSGSTLTLNVTDGSNNTSIGLSAGNATLGTNNTLLGYQCGIGLPLACAFNTFIGSQVFSLTATGTVQQNVIIGQNAWSPAGAIGTSVRNTGCGTQTMSQLQGGSNNIAIGFQSGTGWSGTESSNIAIGSSATTGDNNIIRIGTQGSGSAQQNTAFLAGITGNTATSSAVVVGLNTGTQQLLQTTITAGTGISVTPSGGIITIAATGSEVAWTDKAVSFNVVSGNGYFITATATATLPASPSQGNVISFAVDAAATTLTIQANTGQFIRIGTAISASAGIATNNARGDSVTFVYRSSDTSWIAVTAPQGTWTVT